MAVRILPPQAYLRECFTYDGETGTLLWQKRPLHHFNRLRDQVAWNNKMAGKIAGAASFKPSGTPDRILVGIGEVHFSIHRIIWKLVTGQEPPDKLDHENRKPFDNRWDNIRCATDQQNARNTSVRSNNSTGFKGVWVGKPTLTNRFHAYIAVGGRRRFLGSFGTPEAAHAAYCKAARELFGEFWSPG